MGNIVNYKRIKEVIEDGVRIADFSAFGQFVIQTIGYRLYNEKNELIDKCEVFEMGYDNVEKLLNEEYPLSVRKVQSWVE